MALTDPEKARIRYQLGYAGTTDAASMTMGAPSSRQENFMIESAMDRVQLAAEPILRDLLAECEKVEAELKRARPQLQVAKTGRTELRSNEAGKSVTDSFEREHTRWALRLAEYLGTPLGPYSRRFNQSAGRVGSVSRARS
jgi:CO/xanthine dehydrogenase Mo-binding subunit